eukprot:371735_1
MLTTLIASLESSNTIEKNAKHLLKSIKNKDKLMGLEYIKNATDTNIPTSVAHLCLLYTFLTIEVETNHITIIDLPKYVSEVKSDRAQQLHGTLCIRVLLSLPGNNNATHTQIINCGIVPYLLSFLQGNYDNKLQFEAAWCITNLCSDDTQNSEIYNINTLKAIEHLLHRTDNLEIIEQCIWCLGNIAGTFRNQIINSGMFQFLLDKTEPFLKSKNYATLRNVIWCLGNVVRNDGTAADSDEKTSETQWDNMKNMMPIFSRLLNEIGGKIKKNKLLSENEEYQNCVKCCVDCLWAINYSQIYITLAPNCSYISDIFNTKLIDIILLFLQMDCVALILPSIRIIGTFMCGEDEITEKILKKGFLNCVELLLSSKSRAIRKEICWILSNIAGCDRNIIVQLLDFNDALIIKLLINICLFDDDSVKKEAGWVLGNIISLDDPIIIHFMVNNMGVIGALKNVMKTSSVKKPLIACMDALDIIMKHSKERDGGEYDYITKVEDAGIGVILHILQGAVDDNDKVCITANKLFQKYKLETL